MNTIMITGTAKNQNNKVLYDVTIWGSETGQPIQFVVPMIVETEGYNTLWDKAKAIAVAYFENDRMDDGAYTQFLDHIIIL